MIDASQIKNDFPILSQQTDEYPLTYLDSSNTSLTPEPVIQAMDEYYRKYNANIHRGIYPLSEKATQKHEEAREKVAQFINAESAKEIVFTRNATESINLIVQTWGRTHLKKGDTVVLSLMEHHSNIVPWQLLQKEKEFTIHFLGITEDGQLDLEEYKKILTDSQVACVSLVLESNALGTINPAKDLVELAHKNGAVTLIDAAQSVAHRKTDVQEINSDFFVFTGHKMCGPTGIGVLHAKEHWLDSLPPFLGGGEMIRTVSTSESTWNDIPYKYEAGTPNIAGAIGLGAAVDYLNSIGMDSIETQEQELGKYTLEKFQELSGLKLFGPQTMEKRGAIFSFDISGIHPHDLATLLGEKGICVRAGNHCAQPLTEHLSVAATTRASLYFYNSTEDIDRLIDGIRNAQQVFGIPKI